MAQKSIKNNHLRFIAYFFLVLAILIISRLFYLQIWEHSYYTAIASARHDKNQSLSAHRGTIYFKDVRTGELSVAALDKEYYTVIANPSQISFDMVDTIGQKLSEILDIHDPEDERSLLGKLSQNNLKYVVIARKVSEETKIKIDSFVSDFEEKLNKNKSSKDPYRSAGISTQPATYRFYPEGTLAASVLGFGVKKDEQPIQGQYGIEGFWNDILTGKQGVVSGEKSIGGSWITLAGRKVVQAKDGADVILTIDRTLEFEACKILQKKFEDSHAKDAALVIMNPKTGAILAMCSFPDFDPNNYGQVSSTEHFRFNNTAIFC
jgi:cell division protein FtsI/penicillin-binding protein 2